MGDVNVIYSFIFDGFVLGSPVLRINSDRSRDVIISCSNNSRLFQHGKVRYTPRTRCSCSSRHGQWWIPWWWIR
ncbi:Uncharacterized protein APZ42_016034 [Daphnia magna]|uniref:Uncharacterized protein n=1 Tax=Daphnia magna TaxID=35525 RepID=A0A162NHL5_9CRUS|nr:Uncharacterized protein APZ42_016034 [Daphnia magna]